METEGKYIRIAIVTLPVGLFVLGIASMLYTHLKPDLPENDEDYNKRMEAASLNRKPVNRSDLERFVRILSSEIGERNMEKPKDLERAAIWIHSTLRGGNLGYEVSPHVFPVNQTEVRNLSVELIGKSLRKEVIVVGAHYDTARDCPGANSGGTGVAAVLALAQAFAGDPQERTIRFVFFVNEEPPYFKTGDMGSMVYAKRQAARQEKIVVMLSVDSIGYFSDIEGSQTYPEGFGKNPSATGDFIAFVGDETSLFRADSAKRIFSRSSGLPAISGALPGLNSDQWSFSRYHYPAVLVTDTAQYRYPHFHKPTDTFEKIDFEKFEKACIGLEQLVKTWANP